MDPMVVLIPKEKKPGEGRVSATPEHVSKYVEAGARILVESGAGVLSGFSDDLYHRKNIGYTPDFETTWSAIIPYQYISDKNELKQTVRTDRRKGEEIIILKVKEILDSELHFILRDSPIISFGHLASNRELTELVIERNGTYLSLEDIVENEKRPVLTGMSQIAGEEAVRIGVKHFLSSQKEKPRVIIIGYGNVGMAAHRIAAQNFGLNVTAFDTRDLSSYKMPTYRTKFTLYDKSKSEQSCVSIASKNENPILFILAPYSPENKAPEIIKSSMLQKLPVGSVIVDVSIDQGGACEFSQVTTHKNPYVELERGIKYIGIPNLPGGVPHLSTPVFSESVFPYMMQIIKLGFIKALKENPALRGAVSIYNGKVTSEGLAKTFGLEHTPIETLL